MKRKTHPHHFHAIRVILMGVLLIAVALTKIDAHSMSLVSSQGNVLAYASSMSRSQLLAENNASRAANGLAPMTLNAQLNNSAQAKAQHMADNNYWAHVAPDGTQPWYFFEAAGYSYSKAGENLAYGFDSAYGVNQGWMNSAGHRANVLGSYVDVGFGYVNAASYQGGEYTIVVAHYASPYDQPAPAPAPTPAPAAPSAPTPTPKPASPAPTPPAAPTRAAPTTTTPTATTPTTPTASPATPATPTTTAPAAAPKSTIIPVSTGTAKNVSVLEALRIGTLSPAMTLSVALTLAVGLGFALTHRALMKHALVTSEQFVVTHPTFDAVALALALTLILTTTAARLQ